MKPFFLILNLIYFVCPGFSHGEDDHSTTTKSVSAASDYFKTEVISDKYELLLKYKPLKIGEPSELIFFLSDYTTNQPIDKAEIKVTCNENPAIKISPKLSEAGIYIATAAFPEIAKYSFNVKINSEKGPDFLVLKGIEAGKSLPNSELKAEASLFANPWLLFIFGFCAAFILIFALRGFKFKKAGSALLTLTILFGTYSTCNQKAIAHGGEDHGSGSGKGQELGSDLEVPKETQFLFKIYTQKIAKSDFTERTKLFGTIIPSSNGQASVFSPQNGKLVTLNVVVGQVVKKGQQLGVVEMSLDASSQINLLAEKNNLDAEFEASSKEYNRLLKIQDIVSKRDFSEAEARYRKAKENKQLFESKSGRLWLLRSPIDGTVGNFTMSIGASISANQPIFTITDLSKVYVEAQVFDKDAEKIHSDMRYLVECINDNHKTAEVKLLALAQSINATNQSQRVLFEMENKSGEFKIGEFVNISVMAASQYRQITVKNESIGELNGKPILFVKHDAELFQLNYVTTGENNGSHTVITSGISEGDRVVDNSTYQLKMIYLNQ